MAEEKLPNPLPIKTDTLLDEKLAVAKSNIPSPLKSELVIPLGFVPTEKLVAAEKLPKPLPIKT
jgi:hypothetical protein